MRRNDAQLMRAAAQAATCSTVPGRHVGALIVNKYGDEIAIGWNGSATGIADRPERSAADERPFWEEHAERRAIYEAARFGISLDGATMFVSWFPCVDCARALIECRFAALVYGREPDVDDPKWGGHFRRAIVMLREAGVTFQCEPCEP